MAVLIEIDGYDGDERVVAAVLSSGKILSVEGYDTSLTQKYVDHFGPEGLGWSEQKLFGAIAEIYKTTLHGHFKHIVDPQEARQIIQEAGLK